MSKQTIEQRRRILDDSFLSAAELDDKYNPVGDGEHPIYPRKPWRGAVIRQETLSGYWEWVRHQLLSHTLSR